MKKVEPQNVLLLLIIALIASSVLVYFAFSPELARDIASFLSGVSTLGILGLTAFYVIYTNRQIMELQKQRQLQIQPLPSAETVSAGIMSPRLVSDPTNKGRISIVVDFVLKSEIKNIGNGAAVLVDTFCYFLGKDIKHRPASHSSMRYLTIEQGQQVHHSHSIRDSKLEALYALNKSTDAGCPVEAAFDVMIAFNILYSNILGSGFLSSISNVIVVDDSSEKKISKWIATVNAFERVFASEIAEYNAIYSRSRQEAHSVFDAIADKFYTNCPPEMANIQVLPLSQTFEIKTLSPAQYEKVANQLSHGIPLGKVESEGTEKEEIAEWKNKLIGNAFKSYFVRHAKENTEQPLAPDETAHG